MPMRLTVTRSRLEWLEEIARRAAACREAQRIFYRQRDRVALIEAKACEKRLDEALAGLESVT
jgi:hypothetical protein